MSLTNWHISYTIFSEKSRPGSWLTNTHLMKPRSGEDIKMEWQAYALLFLGIIAVSFIVASIEVWWKSRHNYYMGSAKPRKNNHK
jgi:hypothetical protein